MDFNLPDVGSSQTVGLERAEERKNKTLHKESGVKEVCNLLRSVCTQSAGETVDTTNCGSKRAEAGSPGGKDGKAAGRQLDGPLHSKTRRLSSCSSTGTADLASFASLSAKSLCTDKVDSAGGGRAGPRSSAGLTSSGTSAGFAHDMRVHMELAKQRTNYNHRAQPTRHNAEGLKSRQIQSSPDLKRPALSPPDDLQFLPQVKHSIRVEEDWQRRTDLNSLTMTGKGKIAEIVRSKRLLKKLDELEKAGQRGGRGENGED